MVHPSLPVKNLADLVALAKQNPGKLNYGSAGVGTPGHLTAEMFRAASGIDIQHVPYKGSAPAVTDLIGGQIQIMFDPLQSVLSNVQGGKIRALAVSSKARSPVVPDVPTIAESGYDGFETTAWWGVFAPAGLPDGADGLARVRDRAHRGERRLPRQARAARRHRGRQSRRRARSRISRSGEIAKWGKAVQDAGVKID